MKKLIFIAMIGTLVACGESNSSATSADSSTTTVDTTTIPVENIGKDTAVIVDSVSPVTDTTSKH